MKYPPLKVAEYPKKRSQSCADIPDVRELSPESEI